MNIMNVDRFRLPVVDDRHVTDLVPERLTPGVWFRPSDGHTHLFQNNSMLVWVLNYTTDTDKSVMLPSQLIHVVSGVPSISTPINDRRGDVLFTRLD